MNAKGVIRRETDLLLALTKGNDDLCHIIADRYGDILRKIVVENPGESTAFLVCVFCERVEGIFEQ